MQHSRRTILIATDNTRDQVNGVAVTFRHLAERGESAGYSMRFIDPSCFRNFSAPTYKEVKLAIPFGISRQIEDIRPDYIHIATEGPIGLATKLYCDRKGLRYNTSYHTKFPEYMNLMFSIPENFSYRYFRWFHKHSGVVLTTTDRMCDLLKSKGIDANIIPWTRGVDQSLAQPREEGQVELLRPNVLYVGRISKEKNLEALLCLHDRYNITVVGDGPDRKELERKYTNVSFVGYKRGKELFSYYSAADVFCFPSKTETFGIVMIEAMACGTPVAAYPVDGPLDVIREGINGCMHESLVFAISRCLTLNRKEVVASARKWTWDECWRIFEANLIQNGKIT